jgi:hypothetical protein
MLIQVAKMQLTLALEESLQVASNPAFATPDQENILGSHIVQSANYFV